MECKEKACLISVQPYCDDPSGVRSGFRWQHQGAAVVVTIAVVCLVAFSPLPTSTSVCARQYATHSVPTAPHSLMTPQQHHKCDLYRGLSGPGPATPVTTRHARHRRAVVDGPEPDAFGGTDAVRYAKEGEMPRKNENNRWIVRGTKPGWKHFFELNGTEPEFEVHDQSTKDAVGEHIKQACMWFFGCHKSPYWIDRPFLCNPRQKQQRPYINDVCPVELQYDEPGIDRLPSRIAFAVYVKKKPYGVLVVVRNVVDFGDSMKVYCMLFPDHEQIRTLLNGPAYNNMNMLTEVCEARLGAVYGKNVTVVLKAKPIVGWGRYIGGLEYMLPYIPEYANDMAPNPSKL